MRLRLHKIVTTLTVLAVLVVPAVLLSAPVAHAALIDSNSANQACRALSPDTGAGCDATAETSVQSIIATALNILSVVIGIAAVIMIMIGGFKYVTSSGDASNITSAKNTILFAVIGLVVVALAQFIVRFVLQRVG